MPPNSKKYILVTGGAGFVGAALIKKLLLSYKNYIIVSIDDYSVGTFENHHKSENVIYIKGHTKNIDKLWDKNIGSDITPEVVFHFGEFSRIVQSFSKYEKAFASIIIGTFAVINFCRRKSCKLIYAASSSKFGNAGQDKNLSPYAFMKANNVELIKNIYSWFNDLDYSIIYFFNVYGPGQVSTGFMSTVIGIWEEEYKKGKPLTVVSPGTQTRDFTHIDDIVDGILLVWKKGERDEYQLGRGKQIAIISAAKMFGSKINLVPARKGERVAGEADTTKISKLGWKPKHELADYIKDFIENQKD